MDLSRESKHYLARLDLWWSQRKRVHAESRRAQAVSDTEHQRQLAAGEVSLTRGWYQHPNDPPGYERWWDGAAWGEHTRQSPGAAKAARQGQSRGLAVAGFVTFIIGLAIWPLFLASFVIGIVLAAQGRASDGVILMVLSVVGPVLSIAGCAALLAS